MLYISKVGGGGEEEGGGKGGSGEEREGGRGGRRRGKGDKEGGGDSRGRGRGRGKGERGGSPTMAICIGNMQNFLSKEGSGSPGLPLPLDLPLFGAERVGLIYGTTCALCACVQRIMSKPLRILGGINAGVTGTASWKS